MIPTVIPCVSCSLMSTQKSRLYIHISIFNHLIYCQNYEKTNEEALILFSLELNFCTTKAAYVLQNYNSHSIYFSDALTYVIFVIF